MPSIVATDGVPLVHAPPETELLSIMSAPIHTEEAPLIVPAFATGFTVTSVDALTEPQIFVTV